MKEDVEITFDGILLQGILAIPDKAKGLVIFAHGSGSSRLSPRNQFVASYLNGRGIATLLTDLLTPDEEEIDSQTGALRFDIELLADRLTRVTHWTSQKTSLPPAFFGASTGAAAALIAAARLEKRIAAIVSRGGRPDLAKAALSKVACPTLLIVGGNDAPVIEMNEEAFAQLHCPKKMEIVPNATHLFEEPGCLEAVAKLSCDWFLAAFKSRADSSIKPER